MEKTLVLIKPDAVERNIIGNILSYYENCGLKVVALRMEQVTRDFASLHYEVHKDKPFFKSLLDYITRSPLCALILEGENAVTTLRKVMGPTDSTQAAPDTIRGKFGTDKSTNAIHGSDSVENAQIEIKRFFGGRERKRNN